MPCRRDQQAFSVCLFVSIVSISANADHCSWRASAGIPTNADAPNVEKPDVEHQEDPLIRTKSEQEEVDRRLSIMLEGGVIYDDDGNPIVIVNVDPEGKEIIRLTVNGWVSRKFSKEGDLVTDEEADATKDLSFPMRVTSEIRKNGALTDSSEVHTSSTGDSDDATTPTGQDNLSDIINTEEYQKIFGPEGYLTKGGEIDKDGDGVPDVIYEVQGPTTTIKHYKTTKQFGRCVYLYLESTTTDKFVKKHKFEDHNCDGLPESILDSEGSRESSASSFSNIFTITLKDKDSDGIFESRTTVTTTRNPNRGATTREIYEKGFADGHGAQVFETIHVLSVPETLK